MIQGRRATRLPLAIIFRAVGAVVDSTTLSKAALLHRLPLNRVVPTHPHQRANGAEYDSQRQARSASPLDHDHPPRVEP